MTKLMKIPTNNLALALGGGVARGAFHLGFLDFCETHNIDIKAYSGSSIGAIISTSHASGVKAKEQLKIFSSKEIRQVLKFNFFRNGLLKIDSTNKIIKELLPIEENSEAEFISEHYYGYTISSRKKTVEYEVKHPRWQQYQVLDFTVNVDFEMVYGKEFAFLQDLKATSCFVAKGSKISIESKKIL